VHLVFAVHSHTGFNFPPGLSEGQNSYRSELAGIYGVITMVSVICSIYDLRSGKITIACDNITALSKSIADFTHPNIYNAEADLIYAIKNQISALPISIEFHHVKGHQDEMMAQEDLDRWSLLNIKMDRVAKSVLPGWVENMSHQQIAGEPWSIWRGETKLVNDLDKKLYEIGHASEIEHYWSRKGKFPGHLASDIEKAMKSSTLARRTFVTKHTSGMCGVGKFMKLWGERDTDICP
jgi:hypothetical protein